MVARLRQLATLQGGYSVDRPLPQWRDTVLGGFRMRCSTHQDARGSRLAARCPSTGSVTFLSDSHAGGNGGALTCFIACHATMPGGARAKAIRALAWSIR